MHLLLKEVFLAPSCPAHRNLHVSKALTYI